MRQALDGPAPVGDVRLGGLVEALQVGYPERMRMLANVATSPAYGENWPPDSDTGLVMTSVVSCLPMRMMIVRTLKGRLLRSGVVSLDLCSCPPGSSTASPGPPRPWTAASVSLAEQLPARLAGLLATRPAAGG
jgi:hypothetical protein